MSAQSYSSPVPLERSNGVQFEPKVEEEEDTSTLSNPSTIPQEGDRDTFEDFELHDVDEALRTPPPSVASGASTPLTSIPATPTTTVGDTDGVREKAKEDIENALAEWVLGKGIGSGADRITAKPSWAVGGEEKSSQTKRGDGESARKCGGVRGRTGSGRKGSVPREEQLVKEGEGVLSRLPTAGKGIVFVSTNGIYIYSNELARHYSAADVTIPAASVAKARVRVCIYYTISINLF